MGYGDVGYLQTGSAHGRLETPNLDKLASEGMRFTEAYAGAPVCAPSRCTLITGRHSGHCTVRSNGPILSDKDVGVAAVLKSTGLGYRTGHIGKWGLGAINSSGDPMSKGFDYYFGQTDQAKCHNYYPSLMWRNKSPVTIEKNVNASKAKCGVDRANCSWSGDLWTADAKSFLKDHAAGGAYEGKPFFLYLSYTAPHAGSIGSDSENGEPVPRISQGPYADKTGEWNGEVEYASAVTEIDNQVGIVLGALEDMSLAGNTVVFFASDNGASNEGGHSYTFFNSSGPLHGFKRSLHEGGHRSALIVRWPGKVAANTQSGHQWAFYDFMATAADIATDGGVAGVAGIPGDSQSMLPTLLGQSQDQPSFIYHEYCGPNEVKSGWGQAVRMGNWTAVCFGDKPKSKDDVPVCGGKPLLYDLGTDYGQQNDVAADNPQIVLQMLDIMKKQHTPGEYCGAALEGTDVDVEVDVANFEDPEDWVFQAH